MSAPSTDRLRPRDEAEAAAIVRWAVSESRTLDVAGTGTKQGLGRHIQTDATLDLSALSGVTLYEPAELVLSARAGTPVAEIEALLAASNQMMAFEPMDFGPLLGRPRGGGTLGGLMATNLAGPRRPSAGAARDHALGLRAVSGRGEAFKAGGRVVKNVTGYDLPRGLAGSYGTLAAFTELTIKVLPRPETLETLLIYGLDDATAAKAMSAAVGSYYDVSGAAHVPFVLAGRIPALALAGTSVTALRLEGVPPSIRHRREKLEGLLGGFGALGHLEAEASSTLWAALRDVEPFGEDLSRAVWRVSTAPMQAAAIGAAVEAAGGTCFYDWAGGLIWIEMPDADPRPGLVRDAVTVAGGHATLIRAAVAARAALEVFQPLDAVTGALVKRMKDGFDPSRVLSPGRMYAGV
ncbi:FAD-binding protein [Ancylobacter defluvii]|uniref:2-hydroxy-acid oxidase n=1 Tax=Ancylobacter defluvii TaxID=1282440 RepID=A0A9W6NA60_9HYPH|nr:FAD-binding protein [Ancylobacter defluvii]MBS7590303.1 FAD-binding protein [Ancylobacter defluvii]GLK83217.1 2-hydroxy-acid oxidase [Ancylobacter defluvii]